MAKYKILVIAHSLKNNLVGKFNEVVDESQLTSNAKELVESGFIELVEEVEKETEITEIEVVEPKVLVQKKPKAQK
jgi:hypothetical protein